MAKVQDTSETHPTQGFTKFDILEKHRKSFSESEPGRLHSVFPLEYMAEEAGLSEQRLGRKNILSPYTRINLMVLKTCTDFSDRQPVEHLSGNVHRQMFCGAMIGPSNPITDQKIISNIRNEVASRPDTDALQKVLALRWRSYLENLHACMADATCYEDHMRFPTDVKPLWEGIGWFYKYTCQYCRDLGIRRSRNKYTDAAESYLSYCRKRRREASRTRMLKRRMIRLPEKLIIQKDAIHREYGASFRYTQGYQKRLSIVRKILYRERKCLKAGRSMTIL